MNCILKSRIAVNLLNWRQSRHLSQLFCAHLENKTLIEVIGKDSSDFLQGLITNDIRHLDESAGHGRCLSSFLLNPSGRIIADVLIYKTDNEGTSFMIECDRQVSSSLLKHLVTHKLRKKLSISLNSKTKVYSIFSSRITVDSIPEEDKRIKVTEVIKDSFMLLNDTRLPVSLLRLISMNSTAFGVEDVKEIVSQVLPSSTDFDVQMQSEKDYTHFRYRIGLSEGSKDHPPSSSFPLESNGDLLQAISFFKGCYIGQELTARTYHTGVVRKRLMPVTLPEEGLSVDTEFKASDGSRLGRLRSTSGNRGLALLYVEKVRKCNMTLLYGNEGREAFAHIPFWWPNKNKISS
jgi:folate-binding protein YgfZ